MRLLSFVLHHILWRDHKIKLHSSLREIIAMDKIVGDMSGNHTGYFHTDQAMLTLGSALFGQAKTGKANPFPNVATFPSFPTPHFSLVPLFATSPGHQGNSFVTSCKPQCKRGPLYHDSIWRASAMDLRTSMAPQRMGAGHA